MAGHSRDGDPAPEARVATGAGEPGVPADRLDRLEQRVAELAQAVEAGLAAQARRVESVVGTTRRELVEAMHDPSEVVDATTRAVRDLLHERPEAGPADPWAPGSDLRDELQQDRLTFREGLRRDAEALEQRLGEEVQGVRDHVRSLLDDAVARLSDDDTDVAAPLEAVADRLGGVVDDLATRLEATERRLDAALASLREVQASVRTHLVDRDREAAVERAQLTRAFVEELAGALSRRDRRRLARRLSVEQMADADPPEVSGRPDASPPTAAHVPVRDPVPAGPPPEALRTTEEPTSAALAAEVQVATTASEDAAASRPSRVQPSLGARPVHDRSSTPRDPAAMRRALAAVRGLGPARQAALVEAFGSLDALREASDEELLAIRGIGPSLLGPIRSVL